MTLTDHERLEHHPTSALFPMLAESELRELAEDIRKNGLLEPIVMYDGKILDGRNRFEACQRAGVEPRFVEWDQNGASPTLYVLSKNLHRRHLTPSQQAAIAVEALPLLKDEARKRQEATQFKSLGSVATAGSKSNPPDSIEFKGKTRDIAAREAGVSASTVWEAEQVKKADPEEFERIKRGEVKVHTAYRTVKGEPERSKKADALDQGPRADRDRLSKADRIERIRHLAACGYRADQIAPEIGITVERTRLLAREAGIVLPDVIIGKTRRLDVNRIVNETVLAAHSLTAGLELIDSRMDGLDTSRIDEWVKVLTETVGELNRLIRQLKKRRNAL